jgi:predicted amidohydrolase
MARTLTVGILQMPVSRDAETNLARIEKGVATLARRTPRPELVVGVEGGVGYGVREPIPGPTCERLSAAARENGVYLIPGTLFERSAECPPGMFYNSAPIFGPDGRLIDVYRKMAPWRPYEYKTQPGGRYVVFELPEKRIKVGVLICYDLNFPEICRNLALAGAEVLVKLTEDMAEAYQMNRPVHQTRALENQAFLVSANAVGPAEGYTMYGHSMVVDPAGNMLLEADGGEALLSATFDVDEAAAARTRGTRYTDRYLQHLRAYDFPAPYAGNIAAAPIYEPLTRTDDSPDGE